ncbi:hypothetical protein [Deinococcus sp.]|uniref:hypothetical protein n=1 Tax=Deinococcus sp. TaxID=47478 RepID=UPI00286D8CC0|nr:hypothetical protein [Deinococcus sp.]
MSVFMHAVSVAVPATVYPQSVIRDMIRAQPELDRLGQRVTSTVFNASGIDQRHSVIDEFGSQEGAALFYDSASGLMLTPTTGVRNEVYAAEATKLYVRAARGAAGGQRLRGRRRDPRDYRVVYRVFRTRS